MLKKDDLKVGGKYLYWSLSKQCHIRVVYERKRNAPGFDEDVFVFRDPVTMNEIWSHHSLINVVIDDD